MVGRCNNERGNTPKLRGGGKAGRPWIRNAPVFERGISGLAPDWSKADSVALDRKIKGPRAGICTILPTTPYRSRSCTTTKQGRPKFGKTLRSRLGVFPFPYVVWLPLWWYESDRYYPGFEMNKTGSWGAPSVFLITFQLFLPMWRRVLRR